MNMFEFRILFWQQCWILTLIQFLSSSYAVPHPYCMHPLNRADCNMKPKLVFTYYKPGSRCEIERWRGCPTWNKFHDEYSCSRLCIFRMGSTDFDELMINETLNRTDVQLSSRGAPTCEGKFNEDDCGEEPTQIFTYDEDTANCVKKMWRGCQTSKKFDDEASCIEKCVNVTETEQAEEEEWEQNIENLDNEQIGTVNNIIDSAFNQNLKLSDIIQQHNTTSTEEDTNATSETPTGVNETSETPTGVNETSETPTGVNESSEMPTGVNETSQKLSSAVVSEDEDLPLVVGSARKKSA